MGEDNSHLEYKMESDYCVTTFIVGFLSLIACSLIIYKRQKQLESVRIICCQVIIYHILFIATAGMVLFDLAKQKQTVKKHGTDMLDISDHKVSYTIYSILFLG